MRLSPIIVVVVVVCLVAAGVGRCSRKEERGESTSALVEIQTFPIEVRTTGELDSIQSRVLTNAVHAPEPRKIVKVIPDGTHVKVGDLILRLDSAGFESRLKELNTQIEIQEAEVSASQGVVDAQEAKVVLAKEQAELEVKIAKADLDKTLSGDGPKEMTKRKRAMEKALVRMKNQASFFEELAELQKEGFLSPKEVDEAKRKQKEKEEAYQDAKLEYEHHLLHQYPHDKEVGQTRIEMAKLNGQQGISSGQLALMKTITDLQKARLKLAELRGQKEECVRNLAACEVKAPKEGDVVLAREFFSEKRRKLRVGDAVFYGQPLAEIPDAGSMAVKTKIREADLQKVAPGNRALVTVDTFPNLLLNGEVIAIGGVTDGEVPGEKALEVTVALEGENPALKPGMTARCVMKGDEAKEALCVPIQAVFYTSKGPCCYRKQGTRYKMVPVSVGKVGDDLIQIRAGLKKGDRIALQTPSAYQVAR